MKLIILLMSCNIDRYKTQCKIMHRALISQIRRFDLNDKIEIYNYVGDADNTYLDKQTKTIYIDSGDKLEDTAEKTLKCFEFINDNIEYDYIFRTNTSTFINIRLLYYIISILYDNNFFNSFIGCGSLLNIPNLMCPYKESIELQGNTIFFPKKIINLLLENNHLYNNFELDKKSKGYDDIWWSTILNAYYNNNYDNILNHTVQFSHLPFMYKINYSSLEEMKNLFNIYKNYITISIKDQNDPENIKINEINFLNDLFRNEIDFSFENTIKSEISTINKRLFNIYVGINENGNHQYKKIQLT